MHAKPGPPPSAFAAPNWLSQLDCTLLGIRNSHISMSYRRPSMQRKSFISVAMQDGSKTGKILVWKSERPPFYLTLEGEVATQSRVGLPTAHIMINGICRRSPHPEALLRPSPSRGGLKQRTPQPFLPLRGGESKIKILAQLSLRFCKRGGPRGQRHKFAHSRQRPPKRPPPLASRRKMRISALFATPGLLAGG